MVEAAPVRRSEDAWDEARRLLREEDRVVGGNELAWWEMRVVPAHLVGRTAGVERRALVFDLSRPILGRVDGRERVFHVEDVVGCEDACELIKPTSRPPPPAGMFAVLGREAASLVLALVASRLARAASASRSSSATVN